jgi:hypothetical protein
MLEATYEVRPKVIKDILNGHFARAVGVCVHRLLKVRGQKIEYVLNADQAGTVKVS